VDFIEQLQRRAGIRPLTEAAVDRYRAMFRKYIKLAPEIAETANEFTNWAYKNLRRDDRVVWYLRWVRLGLFMDTLWSGHSIVKPTPDKQARDAQLEPIARKELEYLAKTSGITQQQADMAITTAIGKQFRQQLKHYLDMMQFIPPLQMFVWGYQTPEQLIAQLGEIEQDWQKNRPDDARGLDPTEQSYPGAQKLLEFPDGMAWWNLGVGGCPLEAKSMGHCGNGAGRPGENVLSLRKRMNIGGKMQDVPFLTFILDKRGFLGEMKGRNNDKPVARYHPYIVALLDAPVETTGIEGIKGGGYKPENNFSLNDLDEETRNRLIEKNPRFLSLTDKLNMYGPTTEVISELKRDAEEAGVYPGYEFAIQERTKRDGAKYYVAVVGTSTAKDWAMQDDDLRKAMDVWEDWAEIRPEFTHDDQDLFDVLERLPDRYQDMFLKDLGVNRSRGPIRKLLAYVVHNINKSTYKDQLIQAIKKAGPETGRLSDREKKELLRYMQMLLDYPFSHSQVYHVWDNGTDKWRGDPNDGVTYYVPLDTFTETVDELLKFDDDNEMPDNEFYREAQQVRDSQEGWLHMDDYNVSEDRRNILSGYDSNIADGPRDKAIFKKWAGLLNADSAKRHNRQAQVTKKPITPTFTFDPVDAASILVKLLDNPKTEMPGPERMDRMIESLRRRAGIR
jgi:hypothetical protein